MRDKIELLVEETGSSPQEAELALGLANFDVEDALLILQTKMRDVFVIKAKFLNPQPRIYGLMLFIANVSRRVAPNFRVRFVWSDVPYIYETNLHLHWYDFEKAIYRARLSERSHVALSQGLEKLVEAKISQNPSGLTALQEACAQGTLQEIELWLKELILISGHFRIVPKIAFEVEVLNLREYKEMPSPPEFTRFKKHPQTGDIFVNLRIALASLIPEDSKESHQTLEVSQVHAGDSVFVYILEARDSGLYLAELFGGITDYGLAPIEAPVESVWEEGEWIGVRVRFGTNVVGEGMIPRNIQVPVLRREAPATSFLSRLLRI